MRAVFFLAYIIGCTSLGVYAKTGESYRDFHYQPLTQSLERWGITHFEAAGSQIEFSTNDLDFSIRAGDRHIEVSGIQLHLGYPVQRKKGDWELTRVDTSLVLKPFVFPNQKPRLSEKNNIIVLDAGHGGGDPGATNSGLNIQEKNLTLQMVHLLKDRLERSGYELRFTRTDDTFLTLTERTQLANSYEPLLFISIHFNAATNKDAMGIETFATTFMNHPSTGRAELEASDLEFTRNMHYDRLNTLLAFHIQKQLIQNTGERDRGVKRARFGVIKHIQAPAALLELGFISNDDTAKKLKNEAYLDQIADAIVEGVHQFVKESK